MSQLANEFLEAAGSMDAIRRRHEDALPALEALRDAASEVGKSHSGSWMGYHSLVYYEEFKPPPASADFSVEWGLIGPSVHRGSVGNWQQYSREEVIQEVLKRASQIDPKALRYDTKELEEAFEDHKRSIASLFTVALARREDSYLNELCKDVSKISLKRNIDVVKALAPSGPSASRDTEALLAGSKTPPHIQFYTEALSLLSRFEGLSKLSRVARSAAEHLQRWELTTVKHTSPGTKVFIGHGGSPDWREFKDFIGERLGLPWDEFNRAPIAGLTNVARLSQMLDNAAIAFLIMTAEDEQADGRLHARMNVIHEAGLFQGRLGFEKAIILLEEGCEEFSNIHGLGQLRFPKGNISAKFEEVRRVLEREGVLPEPGSQTVSIPTAGGRNP